ncbi:hypothetical protein [Amycolatopsis sp. FDAARGOS 1241]|uniref:hypothetical protein n=1 Tax=Amycolatopsis sp. FDAARGOS 1241 TaxID=2778070 RepID=UPI00195095D8|nr:hypothetical protein [Amycolatopsis sp. FDAARGOS 1241]QRP47412.1 hypothetical protein I6J71_05440 [Amycolatopsis sp. FDAARGOS 1241]
MSASLVPAVARKLGCRNSIAAAVVEVIWAKADQGWSAEQITTWLAGHYDRSHPAADPALVRFVLARR